MKWGVLLMAHGSPDSVDQMEAYLNYVMKRRKPTPEFVKEMQDRYRLIGGRSPLLDITRSQASALEKKLDGVPVFVGMRHWQPFIHEVLPDIVRRGTTHLVALSMAPHAGRITVGAYLAELQSAVQQHAPSVTTVPVKNWNRQPHYVEAWKQNILTGLEAFDKKIRPEVTVLFTAHSIPEDVVAAGDEYPQQIRETKDAILKALPPVKHDFAWQSRSPGPGKWLEPDVDTKLRELHGKGVRNVLVAPIGFLCDHVEVLYDIDILYAATAKKLGLNYHRAPSLNTHPLFIEALTDVTRRTMCPQT